MRSPRKYDVIIVGAGSAGCVLASRLSEDPSRSVLLLEAGPDYPDLERLPDDLKYINSADGPAVNAPHNWSLVGIATPQQAEPMPVPRGKVVGGSSAINGPTFARGVPEDYDNWASRGNQEWAFHKVLPYFRKLEKDLDFADDFHGSDGPIPIRRYKRDDWLPLHRAFYQACKATGFPEHPDMNSPDSTGLSPIPTNNSNGIRMSTALAYLNPHRHRPNLTVRANVLARRILFTGKRATGVEVESGRESSTVEGEKIILSAGAVASPQLLMLSGVGPAYHLRSLGISVMHDLPGVGQNLRDHPMVILRFRDKERAPQDPLIPRIQMGLRYTATGSDARNDMRIWPCNLRLPGDDLWKAEGIGIATIMNLPLGAGQVYLTSTDPHVQLRLEYRYLQDPWDLQRMREGVRLSVQLLEHQAFRDIIAERVVPTDLDLASDEALDAWILQEVSTAHHSSSTCKMGAGSDPLAVVDQYCRVHGLEGLHVVDASIMPDIVRANTNATTIMMAERVAAWI